MMSIRCSRRVSRVVQAAMLSCAMAGGALASTGDGKYAIRGLGGAQCDVLVKQMAGSAKAATSQRVSDWMMGYLSGTNQATADTFDMVSVQDNGILVSLLLSICTQNPKVSVQAALNGMIGQFGAIKNHNETELLTLKAGDASVKIRAESLTVLQKGLVERGLMEQPAVLGAFDAATQDAIGKYQKNLKLPVTGLPDDRTILMFLSGK